MAVVLNVHLEKEILACEDECNVNAYIVDGLEGGLLL